MQLVKRIAYENRISRESETNDTFFLLRQQWIFLFVDFNYLNMN